MPSHVDPALVWLYQRAVICQTFPAYRLEELQDAPIVDILRAVELIGLARQVENA